MHAQGICKHKILHVQSRLLNQQKAPEARERERFEEAPSTNIIGIPFCSQVLILFGDDGRMYNDISLFASLLTSVN